MSKKQKNTATRNQTTEIVKKVKAAFLDEVVRDWLKTPCKEWGGKTVLQMIEDGKGEEIIDAIKSAKESVTNSPRQKQKQNDDSRGGKTKESIEQETTLNRVENS